MGGGSCQLSTSPKITECIALSENNKKTAWRRVQKGVGDHQDSATIEQKKLTPAVLEFQPCEEDLSSLQRTFLH